jgi:alcohol dehydrogenase class IV
MRTTWSFHSAGQLLFGRDAVRLLGEVAQRFGCKRVLVVTDPMLVKAGLVQHVEKPLTGIGALVDIFPGGEPEPSFRAAEACIDSARTFRPDLLVALGGGSNMDLGKIVATILGNGGSVQDYVGDDKIPGPIWPLVCVPTTAGTGSEVSAAAVLTDTDNHMKVGILSNYLRPRVAIVDPLLTVSCPAKVTADSGIDALTHAIEAYTAVDNAVFPLPEGERTVYQGRHPVGEIFAEKAISLIGQHLRQAVKNGKDIEAREGMSLAATLAGLSFSNVGVAAVHAMEYPVGGAVHCSHGCGNGLLLPWVMRFNLPVRQLEFGRIARLLGEDVMGLQEQEAAERAIQAVDRLRADIGVPGRLRDLGVKQEQLRGFAERAHGIRRVMRVNPRPATVEEVEGVYRAAW